MAVRRWRYVLPNLVTCASIGAAMLSIAEALNAHWDSSAWFALLCVLMDKLDGTVARLLGASSRFGIEMDSLADLIGFGVAPAVLILAYLGGQSAASPLAAQPLFRAGVYISCILYVVAAALRLAKFNILTDAYGPHYFFGIPTTVCGGLMMTIFLTARKYNAPLWVFESLPAGMIACALAMVSRIPLPKMGKRRTLAMNIFTMTNVCLVYVFGLLRVFPEYLLWAAVTYLVVGTSWAMMKRVRPPRLVPAAPAGAAAPPVEPSVPAGEPEKPVSGP
jgi:CDP-diacylglycerol---serine O-phosphatidyltransferase